MEQLKLCEQLYIEYKHRIKKEGFKNQIIEIAPGYMEGTSLYGKN